MKTTVDQETRDSYNKACGMINQGLCPICGESLTARNYCPKHSFVKSNEAMLIGMESFDSRVLEIAAGCS